MSRNSLRFLACLPLLTGLVISARASADDFRIESKVYVGKETEPTSENLTLFRGEKVYDFLSKPGETTVFNKPRGQVILLDPVRKVRTEIKADRLFAFSEELKLWAAKQTDPFLKFAADPRFDQKLDEANGELTFTSQFLTYRVGTIKANTDEIAQQYLEFSDSYARLNALTNPGSMPPLPRLAINAALFKTKSIPERVQMTMPSRQRFGKTTTLRSEHSVAWRLLESDLQRINEADDRLVTYTPVPLEHYLHTTTAAAKH